MKQYVVRVVVDYFVEMPDQLHADVLIDIEKHGVVVSDFSQESDLAAHIAWNKGYRLFNYVEGLFDHQQHQVRVAVLDEAIDDVRLAEPIERPKYMED